MLNSEYKTTKYIIETRKYALLIVCKKYKI